MKLTEAFKCCFRGKRAVGVNDVKIEAIRTGEKSSEDLDFLAPSIHHLSTSFMKDVTAAGLDRDASIYDIEDLRSGECGVIRRKGLGVKCPIDHRDNASYVHSLRGKDHVGRATFMISYAWKYRIGDIIDSLVNYCKEKGLDPKRTYVWICCLCVNQHRVVEAEGGIVSFEYLQETFQRRVHGIRHILALMAPWQLPEYLRRIWCIFEMYEAYTSEECELEVIMPPEQEKLLISCITASAGADGKTGIDELFRAFANTKVELAKTSQPTDRDNILNLIENGPGYAKLNNEINNYMREWVLGVARSAAEKARRSLKDDNLSPNDIIETGKIFSSIAKFFSETGYKKQSYDFYMEVLEVYQSISVDHPGLDTTVHELKDCIAETYNNIGECLSSLGKYDEALEYHGKSMAQLEEVHGTDHIKMSTSYFNIGAVKLKQEDHRGALEMFLKSVEIEERTDGTIHTDMATTYNYIGRTKQALGDLDGAFEMYNKSKEINIKLFGDNHPRVAIDYSTLGNFHNEKEDYDSAIACYNKNIAILENVLGIKHHNTASSHFNIGVAHCYKGTHNDALRHLSKAESVYKDIFGADHPKTLETQEWINIVVNEMMKKNE